MSLILENVSKTYDNEEHATIRNIDLEINQGEFVCVVGKSGCGKSTLLNLIAGLEMPTEGRITLNQKEIRGPGKDRVVMFQENALFPWLTAMENVTFGLELAGVSKRERQKTGMHYLKMMHLWDYRDYPVHQLSGGMKQRVALARCFAMDSEILLMDEPFSALDKQTANTMRDELNRLWMETKKTILFITHSVEEALFLGDRVVILSRKHRGIYDTVEVSIPRRRSVFGEEFVALRHRILDVIQGENS